MIMLLLLFILGFIFVMCEQEVLQDGWYISLGLQHIYYITYFYFSMMHFVLCIVIPTRYNAILCSCAQTLFIYESCPRARLSDFFRAAQNEM